ARCKITVEHLFRRLRESGNEFDGFLAIGLVIVPIESGNIVGEIPSYGVRILIQEFGSSHLEDHRRRAKCVSAGEQRPQIALAAFNGKEWNDENAAIDSLFPYCRRHVREVDFDNLNVALRIEAFLLQDDAQGEIDGRTIGIDADLLALEILDRFD